MRASLVGLVVLALGGSAIAHPAHARDDVMLVGPDPVLVVPDPVLVGSGPVLVAPPPPRHVEPMHTRIGLRTGVGRLPVGPYDLVAVGVLQLTADLELTERTRTFAEYEFLMFSEATSRPMAESASGLGHRANLGLSHEVLGKTVRDAHLFATAEVGGGVALLSGAIGARTLPHGFAGVRFGFDLRLRHGDKPAPAFGFELLFRTVVVPDGAGLLFGLGMQWGD